jgi:hypothetical protein
MKRVFAALITLLFLFNMMGYYFVFSYNQYLVRSEMKSFIKAGYFEDSYVVLKIANSDFIRVDKGEFRYKDKLYDIVSETKSGDSTLFKCINDKNEERLLAGFHRTFELASSQNNPVKARHARAMLYHVIKLALPEYRQNQPPLIRTKFSFINPLLPLSSIFYPPGNPPPKFMTS